MSAPNREELFVSGVPVVIVHVLAFLAGIALLLITLRSAIFTFILPRSARDQVTRAVFQTVRRIFDLRLKFARGLHSYERTDRAMAMYAPVALLSLVATWLALVLVAYMGIYWAIGLSWNAAFMASGSALFTLGFFTVHGFVEALLAFSEAAIGLILIAVLIGFLPTLYGAFSRREAAVTLLEVRAGSPPSAITLIERYHRIQGFERMSAIWGEWERWFGELDETHTSQAALIFFRSPRADRSWVTAAGTILDSAALINAAVAIPHDAQVDLCIRAGFLALRHIADFFRFPYDPNPQPTDHISVTRAEFDAACDHMAAAGVPLKADRDQAWRDFSGWRVNYDTVLLQLARLTLAPPAQWSSDRAFTPTAPEAGE